MRSFVAALETLGEVTLFLFAAILAAFAAVIAWQLLSGRINMQGLFNDKVTGGFSPGRVQLLFLSLLVAGEYLIRIAAAADTSPLMLPAPSETTLALFGGSGLFYLGGKSLPILGRLTAIFNSRSS